MTEGFVSRSSCLLEGTNGRTVQSDDAEDEDNGQSHDNDGVDLETGGLVSVQPWGLLLVLVQLQAMMRELLLRSIFFLVLPIVFRITAYGPRLPSFPGPLTV